MALMFKIKRLHIHWLPLIYKLLLWLKINSIRLCQKKILSQILVASKWKRVNLHTKMTIFDNFKKLEERYMIFQFHTYKLLLKEIKLATGKYFVISIVF